ncbi:hypothetical protein [Xylanimonas sp. McL0601]|uniref:hypothetical protein n=1 Tax=Xylanimonas sp. McL0601 TaxID=3414739 RepID=UPI003CEBCE93
MTQDATGTQGDGAPAELPADPLADLDRLPVAAHVARFEAVHDALRDRLADGSADGGAA